MELKELKIFEKIGDWRPNVEIKKGKNIKQKQNECQTFNQTKIPFGLAHHFQIDCDYD